PASQVAEGQRRIRGVTAGALMSMLEVGGPGRFWSSGFDSPSFAPTRLPAPSSCSPNPHHRLADVLAAEHADQRRRRALDALVDRLAILHGAVLQPPLHFGGELIAQVREVCRDEPADGDAV